MSNTTKRETIGQFCGTAIVNINENPELCQIFSYKKHFLAKKNNFFQRFVSTKEVWKAQISNQIKLYKPLITGVPSHV